LPGRRREETSFQERDSSPGRRREEPSSRGWDSSSASSRLGETDNQEKDSPPTRVGIRREEPRATGFQERDSSPGHRRREISYQERDSSPGRRRRETSYQERDPSDSSRYEEFENQEFTRYRYRPLQLSSGLPSPHTFLNQIRSQQSSTPKSRPWNARVKWITGRVLSKLGLVVPIVVILVVLVAFYCTASPVFPVGFEDDGPITTEEEYFDDI